MTSIGILPAAIVGGEQRATNVKVAVRCRPLNAEERRVNQPVVLSCDNDKNNVTVSYGNSVRNVDKTYSFDKVFGTYSTQEEVFDTVVKPIVMEALDGFNCTIFAYGQTGTGKTHTMEGDLGCVENAGIVPRSIKFIFDQLGQANLEFTTRVSFLELYNEELQDLLSTDSEKKLRLCEDVKKGLVCQNLEEVAVLNDRDIFDILQKGIKLRQTAETQCNKNSSRSHSIFTMKMYIKESNIDGEEVVRQGQLNLVDLAGSECVGRSGAKNDRAREAGSINQSLLTLGRVITALVDHHAHIPYRDSKLTRLLQESLGGKAKTCIIATVSPSQLAVEETLSTLDYAHRAKNIKNAPQQNQKLVKTVHLKEYSAEIESLRTQLQLTREKNGIYLDPKDFYAMESGLASLQTQLAECEAALKVRGEETKLLRASNEHMEAEVATLSSELDATSLDLAATQTQLTATEQALEASRLEMRAAEAVICEQTLTEQALSTEAGVLQGEVRRGREEVASLREKVADFVTKERADLARADDFAAELLASKAQLLGLVDGLLGESTTSSAKISGGVTTLLAAGRDTCAVLRTAVERALLVLQDEADAARQALGQSLTGLETHIDASTSRAVGELQALETSLREALAQISAAMCETDDLLIQQDINMHGLVSEVKAGVTAVTSLSAAHFAEQQAQVARLLADNALLEESVAAALGAQEAALAARREEQAGQVRSHAARVEEAVRALLQDMLADHARAADTAAADNATHSSGLQRSVSEFVTQADLRVTELRSLASQHCDRVVAGLGVTVAGVEARAAADEAIRTQLQASKGLVATCVDATSAATLSEGVANLTSTLQASKEASGERVQSANVEASNVLTRVRAAASAMSEDAERAVTAFAAHMDSEGEQAREVAASYFVSAAASLETQGRGLAAVEESATSYQTATVSSVLKPRGTTPKKTPLRDLTVLPCTRDHCRIRAEIVSGQAVPLSQDTIELTTTDQEELVTEMPKSTVSSPVISVSELSPSCGSVSADKVDFVSAMDEENVSPNIPPAALNLQRESSNCSDTSTASSLSGKESASRGAERPTTRAKSSSRLRPPSARA